MAFRGQRFDIDLSSDDDEDGISQSAARRDASGPVLPSFVKDVTERPTATAAPPPVAPTSRASANGFPAHRKRVPVSRFAQGRASNPTPHNPGETNSQKSTLASTTGGDMPGLSAAERQQIDKENRDRLASMSDESIAKERKELMDALSPSLVQRLLRRANIDEPLAADFPDTSTPSSASQKTVTLDVHETDQSQIPVASPQNDAIPKAKDSAPPVTIADGPLPAASPMHFPRIPQPPPLDPSSPSFLTDLHDKYFPDLAHDPSKLAWMNPNSSPAAAAPTTATSYDPSAADLPVSALRFNFKGELLAPSAAHDIPVTKGLHHHGAAPDAAGYTIGELAHLARSQFPSQRCFAFQTLGRILYRLGVGEFGRLERGFQGARVAGGDDDGDGADDQDAGEQGEGLAKGLWDCVRQGRVLETLEDEANREGGHVSAKAYAVEALWLWRKGGGTEVRAT